MLLVKNEIFVIVDFADGVVAEIEFLKVIEVLEYCDAVEFFNVVFVENQLSKVLI